MECIKSFLLAESRPRNSNHSIPDIFSFAETPSVLTGQNAVLMELWNPDLA